MAVTGLASRAKACSSAVDCNGNGAPRGLPGSCACDCLAAQGPSAEVGVGTMNDSIHVNCRRISEGLKLAFRLKHAYPSCCSVTGGRWSKACALCQRVDSKSGGQLTHPKVLFLPESLTGASRSV